MYKNPSYALLAVGLVLCLPTALAGKPPPTATVLVDCTDPDPAKHDSISAALANPAQELTIEIDGICIEDVVVRRDLVTLRGKNQNADLDGIHSATPGTILGPRRIGESVVTVRSGQGIRFEHLFIGEGQANRSGLGVTGDSLVTVSNCRVENNPDFGVAAFGSSLLFVVDSSVGGGSVFGGLASRGAHLRVIDSDLLDGLLCRNGGLITMTGGSLEGNIIVMANSRVEFGGTDPVTQLPLPGVTHTGPTILMDGDSSIRAVSGSTLQGFGLVLDFSSLVLSADSTLDGPLFCYSGGDAFCGDPTQVTGGSTCGQCMLP